MQPQRLKRTGPGPARSEAGQSLIEFAIMTIVLAFILAGVLDLGRAYFTYLALKDAGAEGAYFGSAYPQCVDEDGSADDSPGCVGANNIPYRVRASAPTGGLVDWNGAVITITQPPALEAGNSLTVTVSTQFTLATPLVGAMVEGQVLTLTATSSSTIIRVPDCTPVAGCQ